VSLKDNLVDDVPSSLVQLTLSLYSQRSRWSDSDHFGLATSLPSDNPHDMILSGCNVVCKHYAPDNSSGNPSLDISLSDYSP